jgi:hypothetical protein
MVCRRVHLDVPLDSPHEWGRVVTGRRFQKANVFRRKAEGRNLRMLLYEMLDLLLFSWNYN